MKLSFIDELAGQILIPDYEVWKHQVYSRTGKQFGDLYGHVTGEILYHVQTHCKKISKDSFKYNGWNLTLITTVDTVTGEYTTKLKIIGNPSKIFYSGKNYDNISFEAFKEILIDFSNTFSLQLDHINITVPTETSITSYLDFNISEESICGRFKTFQNKRFSEMLNNDKDFMGYRADNTHSGFKAYLPAIKFGESLNSIRTEGSYNRTQSFVSTTGVKTWADLLKDEGMYRCFQCVMSKWDDTIIYDPTLKRNRHYEGYINEMILKGHDPRYWLDDFIKTASDKTRKKRLEEYRKLSFVKGEGLHTRVRNCIIMQGAEFRDVTSWLPCNKSEEYSNLNLINKDRVKESKTLLINSISNMPVTEEKTKPLLINSAGAIQEQRLCIACNKDITEQKTGSRFCSSKYHGEKQAKKCRNQISNLEWNKKRGKGKHTLQPTAEINNVRRKAHEIIERARRRMYSDP